MSTYTDKPLYDHISDKWMEKDNKYIKVNRNQDIITTYFRSDEVVDTDDAGDLVGVEIYNGSSSWYSREMAVGFQGSMVSKNIDWIRYMMQNYRLKGIDILDLWNQNIKEHMSRAYQESNFYDIQPQFTHDGLTTGSPVIFGEEDMETGLTMWMPEHFKNTRLFYNKYNQPEGVIVRDKTWTVKKIFDMFIGDDDAQFTKSKKKFNTTFVNALTRGGWNETYPMYRATFKTKDPLWTCTGDDAFKRPVGQWSWLTAYFLEMTSGDKDKKNAPLNADMGDFSQPFAVWNFDKKKWECSSRTPAWYAIWDNLGLQQMDKSYMEDVQYQTRPTMMAEHSMANRMNFSPEGIILVSGLEYDRPPKAIDRIGKGIQQTLELIEMKEVKLRRWFYGDKLQMFTDLARDNKQPVSASQIWNMEGEKATQLSPAIETHSRYLEVTDARMVDNEVQAGRGPFDSQTMGNIRDVIESVLGEVSKIGIRPVFIGPLAQAQKIAQAIKPIQSTMNVVGEFMRPEIAPQLRFKYRWYEMAEKVEEAFDFPQDVVVPKEEYEAMVQAEIDANARQLQQENTIEAVKASKNLQGPVDEDSVVAKLAG